MPAGHVHRPISYALSPDDDHLAARLAFPRCLQHGSWGGRHADALFGCIGPSGSTEAHAVEAVLEHLGVDHGHTIAFSDTTVDLSVFQACAAGVAMGNASDDLRATASPITEDVDHDGLADGLAHWA